jgi:zinc/manganese transport system permease protein
VRVRLVGFLHLLALALAVSLSALTVGAILSTALLIGPAAIALRLAKRPGRAVALSALIGISATWGGVLLAYDSYYWTPGHGWPVSFFVVALVFLLYVITGRAGQNTKRTAAAGIALETIELGEA